MDGATCFRLRTPEKIILMHVRNEHGHAPETDNHTRMVPTCVQMHCMARHCTDYRKFGHYVWDSWWSVQHILMKARVFWRLKKQTEIRKPNWVTVVPRSSLLSISSEKFLCFEVQTYFPSKHNSLLKLITGNPFIPVIAIIYQSASQYSVVLEYLL